MGETVIAAPREATRRQRADGGERAARRALCRQIARLEAELAEAFLDSFRMRGRGEGAGVGRERPVAGRVARLLDLGELEVVRDELVRRLRDTELANRDRAAAQAAKRAELHRMRLEPGRHRFTQISCAELGEPGCGVYAVRPRFGPIGMVAGWWQVKLSSGCPLATAVRGRSRPRR